ASADPSLARRAPGRPSAHPFTCAAGDGVRAPGALPLRRRRQRAGAPDDDRCPAAAPDRVAGLSGGPLRGHVWRVDHVSARPARGADGRPYPHGDRLSPDDADFDETYGRNPLSFGPDEVGSHPASDSPFGVSDMVGNVWEWVRSLGPGQVLYRGGSWYQDR